MFPRSYPRTGLSGCGTRRAFLAKLLAIPAGIALIRSSHVLAQNDSVVVRKNITALDPAELQVLKDAVAILKGRPASDPTGWAANASIHDQFCNTGDVNQQIHFSWWFLPWHRAYLHFTEKKLQAAVAEPKLALPYWDWNATPQLPENYLGADNPLADATRAAKAEDVIPEDLRDLALLSVPLFSLFGGDAFFPGLDPARPGLLELSPHNDIHVWVGGNMSAFDTAALDPIFFGHHGNIDRVWARWLHPEAGNSNPIEPVWLERTFAFTDAAGMPVQIAVADVLDTESLGYRFDDIGADFAVAMAGDETARPAGGRLSMTVTAPESEEPKLLGAEPVTLPITAPDQAPVLDALASAEPRTVVLQIEGLEVPLEPVAYRVYLNQPDATADTATTAEAGYLGRFSIVPLGAGAQPVITARVMVPDNTLERLAATEQSQITIVPVSIRGGPAAPIQVPFTRLSLHIED